MVTSEVIVAPNQTFFDIAMQEDGSTLAAFEWSLINGRSITAQLVPGEKLKNPNSKYRNYEIANYFKGKKQKIATAFSNLETMGVYGFPELFPLIF